jgi:hypothetical protein
MRCRVLELFWVSGLVTVDSGLLWAVRRQAQVGKFSAGQRRISRNQFLLLLRNNRWCLGFSGSRGLACRSFGSRGVGGDM